MTAIAVALAGLWRFWFWWQDRREQTHIVSAEFFSKADPATWRKAFGDDELTRIHFRRLTGIDRRTDHQALIQLHETLGKTDDDWHSLRKARRFVRVGGRAASVRKLQSADIWGTVVAGVVGLLLFLAGCWLTSIAINLGLSQIGHDPHLQTLVVLVLAISYAALFFAGVYVTFRYGEGTIVAHQLRQRLLTLRKTRKRKPVQPNRLSRP